MRLRLPAALRAREGGEQPRAIRTFLAAGRAERLPPLRGDSDAGAPEVAIAETAVRRATVVPLGRAVADPLGNRLFVLQALWIDGYVPRESALLHLWRARPRTRFVARLTFGRQRWSCEVAVEGVQWERAQGPARIQARSCGGITRLDALPPIDPLTTATTETTGGRA